MRIGITGASGFIGSNLVKGFKDTDHYLNLFTNSSIEKFTENNKEQLTICRGRIENKDDLNGFLKDVDIVCHLVGLIVETRKKTFEKTVKEGTEKLVEAALSNNVKKIIYISAIGTEKDAPTKYHRTKYLAEQVIINSGIPYIILRPSLVFGPGDGFVTLLAKLIRLSPFVPIFGDGQYQLQPVFIDDLVSAIVQSAEKDTLKDEIIEIAGQQRLEYREIINIIKGCLNKKRLNLHLPFAVMKIVAALMELVLKPAPLTKDQLTMLEMGNVGDIKRMKDIFNIDPAGFEKELKKYLR